MLSFDPASRNLAAYCGLAWAVTLRSSFATHGRSKPLPAAVSSETNDAGHIADGLEHVADTAFVEASRFVLPQRVEAYRIRASLSFNRAMSAAAASGPLAYTARRETLSRNPWARRAVASSLGRSASNVGSLRRPPSTIPRAFWIATW